MSLFVNCPLLSGFLPDRFVTFVVSEYHPKVQSFWTETYVNTRLLIILKNGFQQNEYRQYVRIFSLLLSP